PRPRDLATMERISPPKPRRDEDALREAAGPAAHGSGLRPSGRPAPGPHRRPERLHRARHTCHGSRGISLSGERGTSANTRFAQRSPISGNHERGTGILSNELDIERLVWNRLSYIKDPATQKRVSRLNPSDEWIITEVRELRIISDE